MRVKVNGKPLETRVDEPIREIVIVKEEMSDLHAAFIVILGILAAYGWWKLWS